MVHTFFSPEWFLAYEMVLHFVFALITIIVSFYAFKVYNLVRQPQPKLFGIAFGLFSVSYISQFFLEFLTITQIRVIPIPILQAAIERFFDVLGIYVHIVLFTMGLITLTYMTLRERSIKTYSLLVLIALISLFFASNKIQLFYILSSFLLLYVLIHYARNYINHKQPNTLRGLIAFSLLFVGSVSVIFSFQNEVLYVMGHVIEGIAYLVILTNLILAVKK